MKNSSLFSRKSLLPAAVLGASLAASSASADVIGGEVSVSYWNAGYGGDVNDRVASAQKIDLQDDLNFDDSDFVEFSAAIEHPVPILPNVKIKHIDLDESANGSLSVNFDGVTFDGDAKTDLDLTHSSAILYYEVLDNYVNLDLGLDVKLFDGQLRIEDVGTGSVSETKIDDPIPMAYVAASVELPLTGLSFGAQVSGISYSGDKVMDAKAGIRYDISLLFVEAGYRSMMIQVEDVNDIDVDADLSGAFISTGIDF
ncbi:MAG: TIGR04219 family outer membrane beta-barrel protein [Oleiphilaceae bacterium]|nr:TIGR04219 family outer membrane beta-barrel protein [Oleiphilaceae bacterium]